MKLKEIPDDIAVHTLTEEEAKELFAILHENGFEWYDGDILTEKITCWEYQAERTCYSTDRDRVEYGDIEYYANSGCIIITLDEFKKRYCEEEKPQPKFKVGDKVKIVNVRNPMMLNEIGIIEEHSTKDSPLYKVKWCEDSSTFIEDVYLEPYTEPETIKETMETKEKEQGEKGNDSENSQLDLCELLQGHEEEWFFNTSFGDVRLEELDATRGQIEINNDDCGSWWLTADGRFTENAPQSLFPSRALYEQYPLDPYTAWMKWQEGQKKHWVAVTAWIDDIECESDTAIDSPKIYFRTPADRDQFLSEIKAVIEKHINK